MSSRLLKNFLLGLVGACLIRLLAWEPLAITLTPSLIASIT
jgi:hypothetical protein